MAIFTDVGNEGIVPNDGGLYQLCNKLSIITNPFLPPSPHSPLSMVIYSFSVSFVFFLPYSSAETQITGTNNGI